MYLRKINFHSGIQNAPVFRKFLQNLSVCSVISKDGNNELGNNIKYKRPFSCATEQTSSGITMHPYKGIRRSFNQGLGNDLYSATEHDSYWGARHTGGGPIRVTCGELREGHVGRTVELVGRVSHQRMGRFIVLRDGRGSTQVVVPEHRVDLIKRFTNMPLNSYISIVGSVNKRPYKSINRNMETGNVEVVMDEFLLVKVNYANQAAKINVGTKQVRGFSTSASSASNTLTTEEYKRCDGNENFVEHFKARKVTCGSLDENYTDKTVHLIGWLDQLTLPRFLHLKDGHGTIQCLLSNKPDLQSIASNIGNNSIIQVQGKLSRRPDSCINLKAETGGIEVIVERLSILDPDTPTPVIQKEVITAECQQIDETGVNSNCWRSHTCGELNANHVNTQVQLCGWLQHRRMGKFLTIRDAYGGTQCLIPDQLLEKLPKLESIPFESVLEVTGLVLARPPGAVNPEMSTGEIEVTVDNLRILNPSTFHPFPITTFQKIKEQLRLQYRYMDLRFPEMQRNLRMRSDILMHMRKYLCDGHAFVEVETPTLFCRTPGGAQEFIVPTRHKGQFYSLVQSPQQFKQMLMAGYVDRYFQVARCYRDETIRGDRQPEFTQLDIEMSFVGREEILNLIEGLLKVCWPRQLPNPLPRLTYKEAIQKYGSDKPDVSYDFTIQDITKTMEPYRSSLPIPSEDFNSSAMLIKGINFSGSFRKSLKGCFTNYPAVTCYVSQINSELEDWFSSSLNTQIQKDVLKQLAVQLNIEPNDLLVLAYGPWEETCLCLGEIRTKLAEDAESRKLLKRNSEIDHALWVVDFPLFTKGNDGKLETCHHPFTAPHPDDEQYLDSKPFKVRSLAYDLVINGNEVGGGSVRAHNPILQKKLLGMLSIPEEPLEHLLKALSSGCPPHAGIALGLDRFVSLACGASSIRDVIAFPKSLEGRDPLSGAPTFITEEEKKIYHISIVESQK